MIYNNTEMTVDKFRNYSTIEFLNDATFVNSGADDNEMVNYFEALGCSVTPCDNIGNMIVTIPAGVYGFKAGGCDLPYTIVMNGEELELAHIDGWDVILK